MLKELKEIGDALEAIPMVMKLGATAEDVSKISEEAIAKRDALVERLSGEEFFDELSVAIAEKYMLIPKGTPFEDVSNDLAQAVINLITGEPKQ